MKYFLPPPGVSVDTPRWPPLWCGGWCVRRCWINNWSREVNNYLCFILYLTSEALWRALPLTRAYLCGAGGGDVRSNAPVTARGRTVTILRARGTSRNLRPAQSNRQLLFILFISFISSLRVKTNCSGEFGTEKRTLDKKRRKCECVFFFSAFILLCVYKRARV